VSADRGLTPGEIDCLFAPLHDATGLIAAVSGGPDSMALLFALDTWRRNSAAPPVTIVTIDHGLRPASADEARLVATQAHARGLPHVTLSWTGPKPAAGLQEAARDARYALLTEEGRRRGASHIVTAHTRSDQAETVLMRLCAGSGPAGLAGMRASTSCGGLVLARPFLDIAKPRLVETCRRAGLPFVDDPSNADPRFARARLRRAAAGLAREGLTEARLARLAARLARDDDALASLAAQALAAAQGPAGIDAAALFANPPALADRALARALAESGASARLERLEHLADALRNAAAAGRPLVRTLAGRLVRLDSEGLLTLSPEPPRRSRKGLRAGNVAGPPHSLGNGDARA
jgi:tRNA(Ile)-lysidine synthase